MVYLCDSAHLKSYPVSANVIYTILFIEYSILLIVLGFLLRKSFKDRFLNLKEYKLYIMMVILSCIIKQLMFLDPCVNYGSSRRILIGFYGLPFYSSESIVVYIWYEINRLLMHFEAIERTEMIGMGAKKKLFF